MKTGLTDLGKRHPSGKKRGRGRKALVAHRLFAPLLGLWGAALGGLVVFVLPCGAFRTLIDLLPEAVPDGAVQSALVVLAAALVGLLVFMVATVMTGRARRSGETHTIVQRALRQFRPIDPARDLGSLRLDDPLETVPFARPGWRDEIDASAAPEPMPAPVAAADPLPKELSAAPLELDLAAFAAVPGRNAVWVEDAAAAEIADPAPGPVPAAPAQVAEGVGRDAAVPEPGAAALARLRAIPPHQLSLAEMVERFAGALHERRTSPQTRALSAADLAAREAALGEALKALAALSGVSGTGGAGREEPLRAALAQLRAHAGAERGAA
jgi:hypothetical protein